MPLVRVCVHSGGSLVPCGMPAPSMQRTKCIDCLLVVLDGIDFCWTLLNKSSIVWYNLIFRTLETKRSVVIAIVFCCFLDKLVFQNLARGRFNIKINRHLSPKYFDGVQTLADGIKQIFPDRMIVPGQELVIKTTQGCVSGDEIGHFY